jgi:hypothetical protein
VSAPALTGAPGQTSRDTTRPGDRLGVSLVTHATAVALVHSLTSNLVVAAAPKFVRGVAGSAVLHGTSSPDDVLGRAAEVSGKAGHAFDVDLGVMATVGHVRAGLVVRNVREPEFATPDGVALRLARQARVGVALVASPDWLLAADADLTTTERFDGDRRVFAIGGERWIAARRVGLRAGLRSSTVDEARVAVAGGLSYFARSGLAIEGQITGGGDASDRGWGLSARVAF